MTESIRVMQCASCGEIMHHGYWCSHNIAYCKRCLIHNEEMPMCKPTNKDKEHDFVYQENWDNFKPSGYGTV